MALDPAATSAVWGEGVGNGATNPARARSAERGRTCPGAGEAQAGARAAPEHGRRRPPVGQTSQRGRSARLPPNAGVRDSAWPSPARGARRPLPPWRDGCLLEPDGGSPPGGGRRLGGPHADARRRAQRPWRERAPGARRGRKEALSQGGVARHQPWSARPQALGRPRRLAPERSARPPPGARRGPAALPRRARPPHGSARCVGQKASGQARLGLRHPGGGGWESPCGRRRLGAVRV
jgi:hypothetical protein